MKYPDIKKILKENKKATNILIAAIIGIILIIAGDVFIGESSSQDTTKVTTAAVKVITDYEEERKNELTSILQNTNGVGKVQVMLSFESGEESVPAVNVTDSESNTKETDNSGGTRTTTQKNSGSTVVMQDENGSQVPIIIKTYKPKVTGAYIVAEGASSDLIQLEIKATVSKLFDISSDKVCVMPMKK